MFFSSNLQHTAGGWSSLGSDHARTINKPLWCLFGNAPRPPPPPPVWLFWMAPKCSYCLHNCTNKSYQGGKWTWAQFKQTKQRRCENTLRRPIESSSPLQKDVSQMSLLIATDCDCLETSCLLPGELCNRLGIKRSVGWPLGYHNYLQSVPDFS